jgi:FkbM family methyltransferase
VYIVSEAKAFLLQTIRNIIDSIDKTRVGKRFNAEVIDLSMTRAVTVSHQGLTLKIATPNQLAFWRSQTFSTKEPETLEWIDSLPEGSILWDIGANVGLYSLYAAKKKNCRVYAFEPSVFNLELLARNIFLNQLTKQVCIVPLALSDRLGISELHMTTTDWGGALSTFDQQYGWNGKNFAQVFEFQTLGLSMEDAVQRLGIPQPNYIKMDVDGIEHLILSGGSAVLKQIEGIHVEVSDDFQEQAESCQKYLSDAGLVLLSKRHSDLVEEMQGFQNTFNQTWGRS